MKIIIVNGFGGCGKDTFKDFFIDYAKENGKIAIKTSIIDGVKILAEKLGWDGSKTDKDRRFLSDLKDALERWKDLPYTYLNETIEEANKQNIDYLFIDLREGKDIDRIKRSFNGEVITILIDREINHAYNNHADDNVLDYTYDWVIDNNQTLEELKAGAETFYNGIRGKTQ